MADVFYDNKRKIDVPGAAKKKRIVLDLQYLKDYPTKLDKNLHEVSYII